MKYLSIFFYFFILFVSLVSPSDVNSENSSNKAGNHLVEGNIIDRKGYPVEGALVAICPDLKNTHLCSEGSDRADTPVGGDFSCSYFETVSDEDGKFYFEQIPSKESNFSLLCWKENYAPALVKMAEGRENLISLRKGSSAKLTLTDGNGRPLENIILSMKPLDLDFRKAIEMLLPIKEHESFKTNADGIANIPNIPSGDYEILFEKSGILLDSNPVVTIGNDSEINLKLPVYPAFSFHVFSSDGNPVSEAVIEYVTTEKARGKAISNEEGIVDLYFYTSEPPDGMIKILAEGFASKVYVLKEVPPVVILERYGTISGKVIDNENNAVRSFSVEVEGFWDSESNMGANNQKKEFQTEDGSFKIDTVEPGTRTIVIDSPYSAELHNEIEVKSGKNTDIGKVKLPEGITLEIEVLDEEKEPLSGATVKYNTRSSIFKDVERDEKTTDYSGKIRWDGLEKQKYTIHVEHKDYARQIKRINLKDTSESHLDFIIVMKESCTCQGYLLDSNNDPVSDAYIRMTASGNYSQSTRSGSDGYFEFDECTPGKKKIIVRGLSWAFIKDIEITEINCIEPVILNLGEPTAWGNLLWNGRPLSGSIYWTEDAHFSAGGDKGEYRLYGMEPGLTYRFGTLLNKKDLSIPNNVSISCELEVGQEQNIEFNKAELTVELPECYNNYSIKLSAIPLHLSNRFDCSADGYQESSSTGLQSGGKYYLTFTEPGDYLLYLKKVAGNKFECINPEGIPVTLEEGSSKIIMPDFLCP